MTKKKHPGLKFMLGAIIGSTVGAISAMMCTTKKGHSLQKTAVAKYREVEKYVKRLAEGKHHSKAAPKKTKKKAHARHKKN